MLFVALLRGRSERTLALVALIIVAGTVAYLVFVDSSAWVVVAGGGLILLVPATALSEREPGDTLADRIVALGKRKRCSENRARN